MPQVIGGLRANGSLMVIGAGGAIQADPLAFSVLQGVRPMNEVYPMERIAEAYEQMLSGDARFRVVVNMER